MAQAEAKQKLQVVPLGNTTDASHALLKFRTQDAHCFLPDDEAMIPSIISNLTLTLILTLTLALIGGYDTIHN